MNFQRFLIQLKKLMNEIWKDVAHKSDIWMHVRNQEIDIPSLFSWNYMQRMESQMSRESYF